MIHHPVGIDADVVRDHVGRQPDAALPRALPEVLVGRITTKLGRNVVLLERISGGNGLLVAPHLFDLFRRDTALEEANQPKSGKPTFGEEVELFVGDLVETLDGTSVFLGKLVEPNENRFGHEHDLRHPVEVGTEVLGLFLFRALGEAHRVEKRGAGTRATSVEVFALFVDEVLGPQQTAPNAKLVEAERVAPMGLDVLELVEDRAWSGTARGEQEVEQALAARSERCRVLEEALCFADEGLVRVAKVRVGDDGPDRIVRRILVREPEKDELLRVRVRGVLSVTGQKLFGSLFAFALHSHVNCRCRKGAEEGEERLAHAGA